MSLISDAFKTVWICIICYIERWFVASPLGLGSGELQSTPGNPQAQLCDHGRKEQTAPPGGREPILGGTTGRGFGTRLPDSGGFPSATQRTGSIDLPGAYNVIHKVS